MAEFGCHWTAERTGVHSTITIRHPLCSGAPRRLTRWPWGPLPCALVAVTKSSWARGKQTRVTIRTGGIGIRHLSGGVWTLEATNLADTSVYNIVIDPDDVTPTNVFAATPRGIFRRPTSGSMNTWSQVISPAFANPSGRVTALIVAGSGATKNFYAAFSGDKVYRSPDGTTWTALSGFSGSGRIALAAGESDPSVVYALCEDGTLNRLTGTSFSVVTGLPASALFRGNQGWYDIAVAVDPTNPNTVFLGGDQLAVFKGTITGGPGSYVFPFNPVNTAAPWNDPTWIGANVHSDVHAITLA